jgi:8-oxo-dGTP diphosphatase
VALSKRTSRRTRRWCASSRRSSACPCARAGLLVTDWVPPRPGRTEGLMLLYDGGILTPEHTERIRLPPDELRSWAWCTEREAGVRLPGLLARRIRAAVQARNEGTAVYLEDGNVVA